MPLVNTIQPGANQAESAASKGQQRLLELAQDEKQQAIRRACNEHDLDQLICHADTTGGLLSDDLRQLACEFNHDGFRFA